MNVHTSLLGIYRPGDGWLYRLPVGWKYLVLLVIAVPPLVLLTWWVSLLAVLVPLIALCSCRIPLRRSLDIGLYVWVLLGLLALYQAVSLKLELVFVVPANVLAAILAGRLLVLTTSTPVLLDALVVGLRPLRYVRINPDTVALLVALMMRSVPFLAGAVEDARMAARARGMERKLPLLLTPSVISAVAYAQRTGEALQARGLPEGEARTQ